MNASLSQEVLLLGEESKDWQEAPSSGHRRDSRSLGAQWSPCSPPHPCPPTFVTCAVCGNTGLACPAPEEGVGRGKEGRQEGGLPVRPFSSSPLEREHGRNASPRQLQDRMLVPKMPAVHLPLAHLFLPLFLVFLLSVPVSLHVYYLSLSFSAVSLPLSLSLSNTHLHLSPRPPRENLLEPSYPHLTDSRDGQEQKSPGWSTACSHLPN